MTATQINRRKALTVVAAAPVALGSITMAKAATAGALAELKSLIEKHRHAFDALGKAIDRHNAFEERANKGEPIVRCLLGGGYSIKQGYVFCQENILSAYQRQCEGLTQISRVAPELAEQARQVLRQKEKENLELLDRTWEETGRRAADFDYDAANVAEWQAFSAICSRRCRTPEEARLRAEYLLTTANVQDGWSKEAKALLESFT